MPVKINGASSGSVTLQAPASGSDVTVTLPAATGTLLNEPAWQSYTPTLSQGASTNISKTNTYSKYFQIGKLVTVTVNLAITGSGTTANPITVTLPVTATNSGFPVIGSGVYQASGGTRYPAMIYWVSTTTVQLCRADTTSTGQAIGSDPAFAVASGDYLTFTATYEAA